MRELERKGNDSFKEYDKIIIRIVSLERCGGSWKWSVCGWSEWFMIEVEVRGVYMVSDIFKVLKARVF